MATYTVELHEIIATASAWGQTRYTIIGLDRYPIFDEAYRELLNEKIIDHFYNQEIGQESVQMFRLAMSRRMNEIMPLYNQLYESEKWEISPLLTVDISTEGQSINEASASSTATSSNNTHSKSRVVASEFPQNALAGNEDYATSANDAASESELGGTSSDSQETAQEGKTSGRTHGFQGSQAAMLMAYRESFLNIDLAIINELTDLFMGIWNIAEDYAWNGGNYDYS